MRVSSGISFVALAGAVAAAAPARADDTSPGWLRPPTEAQIKAAWPVTALRQGIGGHVVLHCTVSPEGGVFNCRIASEMPAGLGFGTAALAMAPQFLMVPATHDGRPIFSAIDIPVSFTGRGVQPPFASSSASPAPPTGTRVPQSAMTSSTPGSIALHVDWTAAPSQADMVRAYPAAAREAKAGGYVALSCAFESHGRLRTCDIVAEQPKGEGFGAAAMALSHSFAAGSQSGSLDGVITEVAFTFAPETLEGAGASETKIEWARRPESLAIAQSFPAQAKAAHVSSGLARLGCTVGGDGRLSNCALIGEEPADLGFGTAALSLAPDFQVNVWTDQGMPIVGERIEVPIRYLPAGSEALVRAAETALGQGDCPSALADTQRLTEDTGFVGLPDDVKLGLLGNAASCELGAHDQARAFEYARRATAYASAADAFWTLRLELGIALDRTDDVVETVQSLAETRPKLLDAAPYRSLYGFVRRKAEADDAAAWRLLSILEKAGYAPSSPEDSADWLWTLYARELLKTGEVDHARAVFARVTRASPLIDARLDSRFDAIVAADPARFDPRAVARRQLESDRMAMSANPQLLALINNVIGDLLLLEEPGQALQLADQTLGRLRAAPAGRTPPFTDGASQLNWTYDERARALRSLGRWGEALAQERAGAALAENGAVNVSQQINLAGGYLLPQGRAADALAALQTLDLRMTSPVGAAQAHAVRACAYAQLGRADALAAELDYLTAHESDAPDATLRGLLCANDADRAAAEIIARLKDPFRRDTMLVDLCHFDPRPAATPWETQFQARLQAVAARIDVQAAVASVGRTERIPLGDGYQDLF